MQNNHTVIQFPKKEQNARKGYGCVYVIGFSNGIVKVGKTKNPDVRLKTHRETLGMVSDISKTWVSRYHLNYSESESILISKLNNDGKEIGYASFDNLVAFAKKLYLYIEDESEYQNRVKSEFNAENMRSDSLLKSVKKILGEKDYCIDRCQPFKDIDSGMAVKRACIEIASLVTGKNIMEFMDAERLDDIIDPMDASQLSEFNKLQNNLAFILNVGIGFNDSINLIKRNQYARTN